MATDLSASFNEQYININMKLKKRFMRKPNISEATNEFIALAIQCENSEQPAFAGQTYIGAAKCEASAGNNLGEAEQYIAAARQFMKAEKKLATLKFYSPDRENLEAAIGCYTQALNKYPDKSPIRISILLELANELVILDHKLEAAAYYEQALELIQNKTSKLMCMRDFVNLLIECGKYERALEIANKMCDSNFYIPENILSEIQVSRVLLVRLVDLDDNTESKSLDDLLNYLTDHADSGDILIDLPFNTDLRIKLQSILISSAKSDHETLIAVAADTKPYLTVQQRELLDNIILDKKSA